VKRKGRKRWGRTFVKFLLVAEIEVEKSDAALEEAQDLLDRFRETVRPSAEWGITLARATRKDLEGDPDLLVHGVSMFETD